MGWDEIANVLTRELWAIVIKIPPCALLSADKYILTSLV
jgi:hypothetical protein